MKFSVACRVTRLDEISLFGPLLKAQVIFWGKIAQKLVTFSATLFIRIFFYIFTLTSSLISKDGLLQIFKGFKNGLM
jgi:hypothetical protein